MNETANNFGAEDTEYFVTLHVPLLLFLNNRRILRVYITKTIESTLNRYGRQVMKIPRCFRRPAESSAQILLCRQTDACGISCARLVSSLRPFPKLCLHMAKLSVNSQRATITSSPSCAECLQQHTFPPCQHQRPVHLHLATSKPGSASFLNV